MLFLLNGLPLNDKYYDGFVLESTPDMLDTVDRIEVVKGPASVLYGSSALFAIVNIITRKGADVNGAQIDGRKEDSGPGTFAGQCVRGEVRDPLAGEETGRRAQESVT
ncbi:MAG TPA: TonB-dependent receptor plug domain-containing protein [Verrucomicrobiae bacterium]|nr:TonB-dependent receptor plug domain-containing protein [Verrucomicrobiae bacterium]